MKKTIAILSIVALAVLTGCASFVLPSPKQLDALARDTNSIRLKVQTVYGNMELDRNMDRFERAMWILTNSASGVSGPGYTITPATTLKLEQKKQ